MPINVTTLRVIHALVSDGRVRRAWLGLAGGSRPLPPRVAEKLGRQQGVEVTTVIPGSPAAAAGVRPEDIVVAVEGEPVTKVGDLQRFLDGGRIGLATTLTVVRSGAVVEVVAVPAELPA